jgi:putative spermidine/putrescine transport system permease protein
VAQVSGPSINPIAARAVIDQQASQRTRVGAPRREGPGTGTRVFSWIVFILAFLYFFLPLYATFDFSLRAKPSPAELSAGVSPTGVAYAHVLADPKFFGSLLYSFGVGIVTIVVSIGIMVPTAYWVRLRLPFLRPYVELLTLTPFVIPPVILVFGLLRSYGGAPFRLTNSDLGSTALLVAAYVVLSFPYMYRAVDVGLRAIDVQSLTEAAQSLGSGPIRTLITIILPNLRVALLSGAFLTMAIVIGEYTIANFLFRPAFGPYLSALGQNRTYEPAAVAVISFLLTWLAMGVIGFIGRGSRTRVQIAGAR